MAPRPNRCAGRADRRSARADAPVARRRAFAIALGPTERRRKHGLCFDHALATTVLRRSQTAATDESADGGISEKGNRDALVSMAGRVFFKGNPQTKIFFFIGAGGW